MEASKQVRSVLFKREKKPRHPSATKIRLTGCLQIDTRWKALDEIYQMYILLLLSNRKRFSKRSSTFCNFANVPRKIAKSYTFNKFSSRFLSHIMRSEGKKEKIRNFLATQFPRRAQARKRSRGKNRLAARLRSPPPPPPPPAGSDPRGCWS